MNIQEKIETEQIQDIQDVMSSPSGRRFLWRLISHCGVYKDINTDDANLMSRKLGQRSVGLWMLQVLGSVSQDKLFGMMKEAEERDIHFEKLSEIEDGIDDKEENFISSSSKFI